MKLFKKLRREWNELEPGVIDPATRYIPAGTKVEFIHKGELLTGTIFGRPNQPLYWAHYDITVGKKAYMGIPAIEIRELTKASKDV